MMGPNMNLMYNMFGGAQNFQQRYNQAMQMCQQRGMNPQQMVQQMVQSGQIPQDVYNNAVQQANTMFGQQGMQPNQNNFQGGNNYGNNFR